MADLKTTNIYGDAYINNKVGINTNTPATRLQIGQLSPTAATEGLQFGDDTGARLYRDASGRIAASGNFTSVGYVIANTYLQTLGNLIYPSSQTATQRLEVGNASGNAWVTGISIAQGGNVTVYNNLTVNNNATVTNDLTVNGNTYLGNANGDTVFVNDTIRIGATDSGDASLFFGEGGVAGSDYGARWYWDSGYTFTWYTRNAGTDTALFDYVTNDLNYINWRRHFHMQNKEINYNAQVHFNAGTRFVGNNTSYLIFRSDSTGAGGIQVQDGSATNKGYTGYWDAAGGGILNNTGNWAVRYNFGNANSGGTLYGDWTVNGNISATNLSGTNTGDQTVGNGTITIAAGTGISVASNTFTTNQTGNSTVTVTNSGVTSNVAGTGISVSGATGAVTITNSGVTSLTGTANRVTVSAATGAVTLNLPQDIHTGASPSFSGLTVTGITMTNLTGAYQNTTVYDSPRTQSATPSRGIRAPASSIQFTDSYAIAPFYTYRSTGDWPVPYGIGWGTGGESSGIFQRYASNGSSFGDMIFYTGNDGSGAFSFRRHTWEGTTYFAAGSGELNTELFRIDWAGKATAISFGLTGGFVIDADGGYGRFNNWVNLNGYFGLFSGNNNAHIYPNNGSYGAWAINGTRNGWGGIEFANNGVSLMMGSDTVGFHQNTNGWLFRVHNGSGFIYKGSWGGGTAATIYDTTNGNGVLLRAAGGPGGYGDWNTFGNVTQTTNVITTEYFNLNGGSGNSNFPPVVSYTYGILANLGSNSDARAQVYISHAGNDLIFRGGWGTSSWQTWNRCLTNINSPYAYAMNQHVRTTDNVTFGTVTAALSGNATTATTLQTARNINGVSFNGSAAITVNGLNYNVNNDWLRENGDDDQFKLYGNSRTMIYRTDGNTNAHGGGGYAHIFYYGGSADNQRMFIINTDGRLWSNYHGWLDTMSTSGNSGNVSISNLNTQQVSVGLTAGSWYTIAANSGDRASAKFTITDSTSGLHQAVHFYATAHFGNANGAKITVVSNTYYSGPPFGNIRIMTGGTYDGAMVQVYINTNCTINVSIYDNQQVSGWIIKSGVVSTTNPGTVAAFASLTTNSSQVDLNSGKSFSVTDDIYIGGTTTQYKALHAGNYNSYAPSLTGANASGTWSVNITGNAATATSATSADNIDGRPFVNTNSNSATNADTINSNGISYYTSGVTNFSGNATDGALFSQAYSNEWQHQIAGDYRSGQIALRGKNNGTWQAWRTVLDSTNYSSYAGGLSTGNTFTNTNVFYSPNNTTIGGLSGNYGLTVYQGTAGTDAYMTFHVGGDFAGYFGLGGAENDLVWGGWSVGNFRYRILHSSNAPYAWNMNQYVRTTDNVTFGTVTATLSGTATNAGAINSDTGNVGDNKLQYWQTSGNTTLNPDGEWYNAIRMGHGNPVTYYSNTLAVKMTGTNLGDIYTRTTTNGSTGSWNRFWNNNNDGASSGLDADLLDGNHASAFALVAGSSGQNFSANAIYPHEWIRFMTDTGIYWNTGTYSGFHIYPQANWGMSIRAKNNGDCGIQLRGNDNTSLGAVYTDGTSIGFLTAAFGWGASFTLAGSMNRGTVPLARIEAITAYTILGNSNASAAAVPSALSVATVATMLSGQTMNINGSSTSCSGTAANATTAGGLAVHTGTNNEANKIVRTEGNGYIMAGWINTISGDNGTTAIDRVYASSDGYIRYYTPANFRTVLDVPTRAGSGASGNWAINVTGNAATATTATTATNVAASGITGQTGMWTSAARPGPYRLYRNDHDSAYNLQLTWQAHRTNYWSLRGYLNDTFHAECFVVYSGYADEAGALTIGNTYRVANLGINVAASNKLHINGDGTNPAIRIDNGALVTGVASNSKNTFQGYLPVSFGGTTYYIRLWT